MDTTQGAAKAIAAGAVLTNITVGIIGVTPNVVIAASFGVLAGLAWNYKDKTRKEIIAISVGSMLASCAVASLVAFCVKHVYKAEMEPAQLAPLALLIALFGPRWVPAVNERIGPWLDKLPFIGKKGG